MTLKTKLIIGLGFLFLIIFTLVGFCSYYVGRLGQESENILKANYESLVYAREMLSGLDDIKTSMSVNIPGANRAETKSDYYERLFDSGKKQFETNLSLEKNNITEIHEQEYVDTLSKEYDSFMKLCAQIKNVAVRYSIYFDDFLPASERLKKSIDSIYDVNMQAVIQKSRSAKESASRFINSMAVIGTICLLLAFAYLWYFPVYISTTMTYLSDKMKGLLKTAGLVLDVKTNDETIVILHAINLLQNKMGLTSEAKQDDE
jgi:two-component system, NtrC family, sensor histidine kinase KinB